MPHSQYLADLQLNWFRGTSFAAAPSTNIFVSVHSADPGAIGVNNDVTTTIAAARATLPLANLSAPGAGSPSGRSISNTATVTLTNSALAGATLTYFGLWDAVSSGNFLTYGLLTQPVNVLTGDIVAFPSGLLIIRAPGLT